MEFEDEVKEMIDCHQEGDYLDFKEYDYQKDHKEELVKDILALANSHSIRNKYIIIGAVEENNACTKLREIDTKQIRDEAEFQQIINTYIYENLIVNYRILNIDGSSIMGYLKIPCISINLPIYHGTSGTVLEHGIGHLAASSFPIGGKDTHAVLTGHTGLSSAKIFTDLTEMKKGDFFFIHVLDKKLAYRVDQITVVEPQDTKELQIMEGKDHVTLVTCTPYGVNDKRLLVRGVRTAYHAKEEEIRARNHHSQWMEVYKRAIFAGLLIICVLIAARKVYEKMKRKSGERRYG